MKKELTQKQENFTLNLFDGMTQREAWIQAGYSSNYPMAVVDKNACVMAAQSKIKVRLAELNAKLASPAIADKKERQIILTEIARGRLTDYTNCGSDRDSINVGPESPNQSALQEVTSRTEYDKDGTGAAVVTRVKLHDPIRAVDVLNKMDRLYGEPVASSNTVVSNFVFVLPDGTRVSPKKLQEVIDVQGQREAEGSEQVSE